MIETCPSCGVRFKFLRYAKTGKSAPIQQAANGYGNVIGVDASGKPTLVLADAVDYRILGKADLATMRATMPGLALFVSHFAMCPKSAALPGQPQAMTRRRGRVVDNGPTSSGESRPMPPPKPPCAQCGAFGEPHKRRCILWTPTEGAPIPGFYYYPPDSYESGEPWAAWVVLGLVVALLLGMVSYFAGFRAGAFAEQQRIVLERANNQPPTEQGGNDGR